MKHVLMLLTTITLFGCGNQNNSTMEKKANKAVGTIEIVIFKTKPEFSQKEVIDAARAVNPVVKQFNGYLGRKLATGKDSTWVDIVYWTNLEAAEHANQEIIKSETCQKFFSMIDEESMDFRHFQTVIVDKN